MPDQPEYHQHEMDTMADEKTDDHQNTYQALQHLNHAKCLLVRDANYPMAAQVRAIEMELVKGLDVMMRIPPNWEKAHD